MKHEENPVQTLNNDFSVLTEENRKSVIEMTKFLVLTQNTIVPELLNHYKALINEEGKKHAKNDVCYRNLNRKRSFL